MQPTQFSRTAWSVAAHRAAHQILEGGSIFRDPFAHAILGPEADAFIAERSTSDARPLRLFVATRARFAEDSLGLAVQRGVRQAVVLGAGLDTLALRNPHSDLVIFEADHPATQEFKRGCLERAGFSPPGCLRFAPIDFENESLIEGLRKAGLDFSLPTFFIWLGVVPYLTREAIFSTLAGIASLPDAEIVFDYSEPLENYAPQARVRVQRMAERAAAAGEPWLSYFDCAELAALLALHGFADIEDLGPAEFAARYFDQPDQSRRAGPHIVRARKRL